MTLQEMSNGFGQLVPYTLNRLDASGQPTADIVSVRSQQDLIENLRLEGGVENEIRPVPQWPTGAVLPSGLPGNHFLYVSFTQPLDLATVLDGTPGSSNSGLSGGRQRAGAGPGERRVDADRGSRVREWPHVRRFAVGHAAERWSCSAGSS